MSFTPPSNEECRALLEIARIRIFERFQQWGLRPGDAEDAEEAANTALKQLLSEIDAGRDPRNRAGWITTVARRRAVDIVRRRGDSDPFGHGLSYLSSRDPLGKLVAEENDETISLIARCARAMFEPEEQEIFEGLMHGREQANLAYEHGAHDAVAQRVHAAVPDVAACAYRFVAHTKPKLESKLHVVSCIETLNELSVETLRDLVEGAAHAARGEEHDSRWGDVEESDHQLSVSHYLQWTLSDLKGRGQPSRLKKGQRRLLAGAALCASLSLQGWVDDTWISDEAANFQPQSYDDLLIVLHAMRRSMNLEVVDPFGSKTPEFQLADWLATHPTDWLD